MAWRDLIGMRLETWEELERKKTRVCDATERLARDEDVRIVGVRRKSGETGKRLPLPAR